MLSRLAVFAALFVLVNGASFAGPDSWLFDPHPIARPIPTEDLPMRPAPQDLPPVTIKHDKQRRCIDESIMPPVPAQLELDNPVPSHPMPRKARRHPPFDHPFDYPADIDFLRNRAWT